MNGGAIIASVLAQHGVRHVFTLCGGHISPILVEAKKAGMAIIDVRDEASAVFAADAIARLTGVVGVAAVTAGPGVTNTLTAVQNARMAESPLIVLGGATATVLKGRGSLQDIDQMSIIAPMVKWATRCTRVRHLGPTLQRAFHEAQSGVPGPVFVECPVDLLYEEATVRDWYMKEAGGSGTGLAAKAVQFYLDNHLNRMFKGADAFKVAPPTPVDAMDPSRGDVRKVASALAKAERPALVVGSQVLSLPQQASAIADALRAIGAPAFLGGSARGLLGAASDIQFRHKRSSALRKADVVLVLGFPLDFRLGYGHKINRKAQLFTVNRSREALRKNRRPTLGIQADAGRFLQALAKEVQPPGERWQPWFSTLRETEQARDDEILSMGETEGEHVNVVSLCQAIEARLDDDSVLVVDGGDFVATASYIVRPRGPLSWLDPGVFGTLGVGGGFALGASAARPNAETWLIYGDGASGFSLAEFDSFARHGMPVIAVVGTDASWGQIARDQSTILGDDVGTVLARTAYHEVAQGYGGRGLLLDKNTDIDAVLDEAKAIAKTGTPVLINAWLDRSDFRKGSISM